MQAFSETTGRTYSSWDDLVAAEANGYVAVAILTRGASTWPWVLGPFPTKVEANRARARLRTRIRREAEYRPTASYSLFVRPAWKDDR